MAIIIDVLKTIAFPLIIFIFLMILTVMLFKGHHKILGGLMIIGLCISGFSIYILGNTYISLDQQEQAAEYQLNHANNQQKIKWSKDKEVKNYLISHHKFNIEFLGDNSAGLVDYDGNKTTYPTTFSKKESIYITVIYKKGRNYIYSIESTD